MVYRLILPDWAVKPGLRKVLEGQFSQKQLLEYNAQGYNVFSLPNYPSEYDPNTTVDGSQIDTFRKVFVDCDLKANRWPSKDAFVSHVGEIGIQPSKIIDSGNGVHVYWRITNLDAMGYMRFQRRLARLYETDTAVAHIYQLMRVPGFTNTKIEGKPKPCELWFTSDTTYTAEEFDKLLPPITREDEAYCQQHYEQTYRINDSMSIDEELPVKFGKFLSDNPEAKSIWKGPNEDRSKADYRLAHLMFANDFTRDEALSVLVNSEKAIKRAPIHRQNYALNIVNKIWTFEQAPDKSSLDLSMSVKEILQRSGDTLKGTPFRCHPRIDNTVRGYRLGDVLGLVGGSGIGKTELTLNAFQWFAQNNPDYHHFFVPLEQPANEIADRWQDMCGKDTSWHTKVHIISNYDETGNFRHLSLGDIKDYIEKFQTVTGFKVGCVVIDHIGALRKKGRNGENQDLMDICHSMKAFAIQTNTFLIMQSQASREKAGIGDLELDKNAAYGTVYFESYVDYLLTIWQPLKRCAMEADCPSVTAFKFCKIRHKKPKQDVIQEDVAYYMYFDTETRRMRDMTQQEKDAFRYYLPMATNKRKLDRKTEVLEYKSVPYQETNATSTKDNQNIQ